MLKHTSETELIKKMVFVATHSKQGDKAIIIVPKPYRDAVRKLKNPLKVTIEEIIE